MKSRNGEHFLKWKYQKFIIYNTKHFLYRDILVHSQWGVVTLPYACDLIARKEHANLLYNEF